MFGRRIVYLTVLAGCGVFYIAYGEWMAALLLAVVLGLPWLSLLLSLPAIFTFRAQAQGPEALTVGDFGEAWLLGGSAFPLPPFYGRLRLRRCITGQEQRYRSGEGVPTEHCGGIAVTVEKARVCDYLGLFAFPAKRAGAQTVLVRPRPLPVPDLPEPERRAVPAWRPKAGGGFAENHELRLYRPGDSLNQVHWKLSAKTGQLTVREPMEPLRGLVLLTLTLSGTAQELDRKLGRLLWVGQYLLGRDIPFTLRALTGDGVLSLNVSDLQGLEKAVDTLLCAPAAASGSLREQPYAACWRYHIGGQPDET